jgi:3-hydroxypropionyl-CoA synthetase (ADP-forming)
VNELFDMARALALQPPARGQNVAIVTNGAGLAVTAIDLSTESGISVGAQTRQTIASLERVLPSYAIIGPAIDLSGSATAEDFETAMHLLLKDPQVDVLIPFFVFQDPTLGERIIDIIVDMKDYGKPIVGGTANGGPYTRRIAGLIEERGVPILSSPERTISAVRALIQYGEYLRRTKLTKPNPTRIKVQDQK